MTKQQMREVLGKYQRVAHEYCVNDTDSPKGPERLEDWHFDSEFDNIPTVTAGRHVQWMCLKAQELIEDDQLDKANRWLGFIQGYRWCEGLRTINEMREDNR